MILYNDKMAASKKGRNNVLFNDALNTFYLRLYSVRHMFKGHRGYERGNPLGYYFGSGRKKEGNVLFNDALNIFTVIWRQTYGEGPLR